MPNGNVITIVWELRNESQSLQEGRDSSLVAISGLWPDYLLEYNPTLDSVVWEWHAWDHMVQDYDPALANFGVVADHPELFDLNFSSNGANPDWLHLNAVDYNAQLDQLLFSSPQWNEIFIIDHSTTTLEAASHTGGNSGMGGDILWRWGNPITYQAGDSTDQVFYFQHDAHWIPQGYPNENKIILFNNGRGRSPIEYSSVEILEPSILSGGSYELAGDGKFLPIATDFTYTSPTVTDFFSKIISSADQLPNGNIIIDEGTKGHYFEIDTLGNVVWDYVNPVVGDSILTQEQIIPGTSTLFNSTFRARRYGMSHPGLPFLALVNQGPIELNPYPSMCAVGINEMVEEPQFRLFPNPATESITIATDAANYSYRIINSLGQQMQSGKLTNSTIDIQSLNSGIYLVHLFNDATNTKSVVRLIKR
ncbi:MAG: aryl-sulfate sulfotransferase [Flavobacteriales bacterium]|nr:aryl-sulfate sulfotransferase [Flavobacteriales bacterium]